MQAIETAGFDLAIIDVNMPEISGYELVRRAANRNIPSLLSSGHPDADIKLKELECPYLAKPYRVTELIGQPGEAITHAGENIRRSGCSARSRAREHDRAERCYRRTMTGVVVIAASAGGLDPLRHIIAALPVPCLAAVFVVMHTGPHRSVLPHLLSSSGQHPATFAEDGALIEAGHIYVAPPDHHMFLETDRIQLDQGPKVHHTRPAADPLFISAAESHGQRVMGIVLSGGDGDGAAGLRAIAEHGGTALVQSPLQAEVPSMPRAAMIADHPDACLLVDEIAQRVSVFCSHD